MALQKTRNSNDPNVIAASDLNAIKELVKEFVNNENDLVNIVHKSQLTDKQAKLAYKYYSFFSEYGTDFIQLTLRGRHLADNLKKQERPKTRTRSNASKENTFVIIDTLYKIQGTPSTDYDKLTDKADRHNEKSNEHWWVVSVKDLEEMRRGFNEFLKNPKPKTRTRANYSASHTPHISSLLNKINRAKSGVPLNRITPSEKKIIVAYPNYFVVRGGSVFAKDAESVEKGIELFANRAKKNTGQKIYLFELIDRKDKKHTLIVEVEAGNLAAARRQLGERINFALWKFGQYVGEKGKNPNTRIRSNKAQYGNRTLTANAKEFQGGTTNAGFYAVGPDEMPQKINRAGELKKLIITTDSGQTATWEFNGDAWLGMDLRKNLHLLGKDARIPKNQITRPKKGQLFKIGTVEQLDYLTAKQHLENGEECQFFHELGEVDGQKPIAYINHEGFIMFFGGNYNIGSDGIEN